MADEGAGRGHGATAASGRAFVIHPVHKARGVEATRAPAEKLAEAVALAQAINLDVVHAELVPVARFRPATLIGTGAVEALGALVAAEKVELVIVNYPLSPVQQRNLERTWKCKVIDRTGLILEIFGERARTAEGQLQVELAALTYQRSRLVRSWTHLERQRGGFGFLGGPGESQLEIDRRLIGDRILRLKRDLENVRRTRGLHRAARRKASHPLAALVGYTNAGKSTLFNRLTGASVLAKDVLFATLDPTLRSVRLPSGRDAILSDTVGFISDLPTDLVAAFRATLEEVQEADLILHVRDISHPESEAQRADVMKVLAQLGLDGGREMMVVEVWNKIDLFEPERRKGLVSQAARSQDQVATSAATGEGCERLLEVIDRRLSASRELRRLRLPLADGATIAWVYAHGDVVERRDDGAFAHLTVRLDPADAARLERRRSGPLH